MNSDNLIFNWLSRDDLDRESQLHRLVIIIKFLAELKSNQRFILNISCFWSWLTINSDNLIFNWFPRDDLDRESQLHQLAIILKFSAELKALLFLIL